MMNQKSKFSKQVRKQTLADQVAEMIKESILAGEWQPGEALPGYEDVVVLPGSKSTIGDLLFMREKGWDVDLQAHLRRGVWVVGLYGGYRMLGERISDPHAIEGNSESVRGLGLLALETELGPRKVLAEREGRACISGEPVRLYDARLESGGGTPGEVVAIDDKGLVLALSGGRLRIGRVRADGPKEPAQQFAQRVGLGTGDRVSSGG